MKIFTALLLIGLTCSSVMADSFFQNNNPFPTQTNMQNMNNIYETSPAALEQEKKTDKKVKKSGWWRIKEDTSDIIQAPKHERAEDSGFIIVK